MKKWLLAGLTALGLSAVLSSSMAQGRVDYSGTYTVSGKDPSGASYTGEMTLTAYGDGYRAVQTFGRETYRGVANDIGPGLAVAWQWADSNPSVSIYQITNGTTLTGFWQDFGSRTEGQETAVYSGRSNTVFPSVRNVTGRWDWAGSYSVDGTNPDGTTYRGIMNVSVFGDGYRITFVSGGVVWRGIANDLGNYLAIAYDQGDGTPFVSILEATSRTDAKGYFQSYNSLKEGTEKVTLR